MNLSRISLILFFAFNSFGNDFSQNMYGENYDSIYEKDSSEEKNDEDSIPASVFGATPQQYTDEELSKMSHMSDKDKEWLKGADENKSFLANQNPDGYLEIKNENILKESYQATKSQISFTYLYDTFDYQDSSGVFKNTFQSKDSEADATQAGYMFFNYKRYLSRDIFSTFFQGNLGVSFNTGKGQFESGGVSRTTFNLWLFPLDLNIGGKVNFSRSISLTAQGGLTVMPIWQNRDDREEGEDDKDIRQLGYGYNAMASLDFSLSQMFKKMGSDLRVTSGITDLSMSITARTMDVGEYKKEDFRVSGASFGLGFNFEYL